MKVEVLFFKGCPNHLPTVERVCETLHTMGRHEDIREIEVDTHDKAEANAFLGSPSVRINGADIEPSARDAKVFGLTCRTYVNGATRTGLPSRELISAAIAGVDGVSKVEVQYEKKQAIVTYDDAKTDTKALIKATTNAGFPSEEQK
jgi:copper chaperone CopZ